MTYTAVVAILAVPFLLAIIIGSILLKRAFALPKLLLEEIALAIAWVFVVGSLIWLGAFLTESTLLGFSAPWTWLTAAHFAFAGYGALTITALSCRVVSNQHALRILRILLIAHPVAYLVTAAGISGYPYCDELGAISYQLIFITQLWTVILGRPNRIARSPRLLLILALAVPIITLIPALAWALGTPIFDLARMIQYHGIVNAIGHVGLAFAAFGWGHPPSQHINNLEVKVAP
ncbi:MAG: YndJ family transporter [Ardenticatenaceae bacterium]|nr:YndJ family transporter [Anaerolineales bacterium]MCB9008606.1 YndJ family transporter [Ardenticatenaceae bacterium]